MSYQDDTTPEVWDRPLIYYLGVADLWQTIERMDRHTKESPTLRVGFVFLSIFV